MQFRYLIYFTPLEIFLLLLEFWPMKSFHTYTFIHLYCLWNPKNEYIFCHFHTLFKFVYLVYNLIFIFRLVQSSQGTFNGISEYQLDKMLFLLIDVDFFVCVVH